MLLNLLAMANFMFYDSTQPLSDLSTKTPNETSRAMPHDLTPSQENYLEHILRLSDSESVRVHEIAKAAGVRLPSVTRAVNRLADKGLVRHQAYGGVEITPAGVRAAQAVRRRDECLSSLLIDVLRMDSENAKTEVCRLEHVLGLEVLGRLEVLVRHATATGSEAWLKALHRRLRSSLASRPSAQSSRVGNASLHAGRPLD